MATVNITREEAIICLQGILVNACQETIWSLAGIIAKDASSIATHTLMDTPMTLGAVTEQAFQNAIKLRHHIIDKVSDKTYSPCIITFVYEDGEDGFCPYFEYRADIRFVLESMTPHELNQMDYYYRDEAIIKKAIKLGVLDEKESDTSYWVKSDRAYEPDDDHVAIDKTIREITDERELMMLIILDLL